MDEVAVQLKFYSQNRNPNVSTFPRIRDSRLCFIRALNLLSRQVFMRSVSMIIFCSWRNQLPKVPVSNLLVRKHCKYNFQKGSSYQVPYNPNGYLTVKRSVVCNMYQSLVQKYQVAIVDFVKIFLITNKTSAQASYLNYQG